MGDKKVRILCYMQHTAITAENEDNLQNSLNTFNFTGKNIWLSRLIKRVYDYIEQLSGGS